MKNIFRALFLTGFVLLASNAIAQKNSISGMLMDTLGEPLINGTLVLLNPQDSVMEYFAISDIKGNFEIKSISDGDYIFQASYIGYQSFYKRIKINGKSQNLGVVPLIAENLYLEGATVTADRIPIIIKNDTIEYNAGSFRTQPNDVVQDLLKKLPGVEVEKDGTIRAQGQEVESITVDGKEFFGNDPTIASQNLPADAIDKVQVFDRQSEMADFTGVDDGIKNKAINLKLKEDKKKGAFGKITAGYGTQDRYEGKVNVNRFNKKSQLSFLGRANNINEQGFSFEDYINFSGGLQNLMSGGGSMEIRMDGNDGPIPFDFGQPNYGFTKTLSGGLNFNYDFSKNTELQSSYFVSQINKEEDRESYRQNFLGDEIFPSEEIEEQDSKNLNHRLNLNLKQNIDSTQVLRLRANLNMNDRTFDRLTSNKIFNVQQELENAGKSDDRSTGTDLSFASTVSYMLRLKKNGRSFASTLGVGGEYSDNGNTLKVLNQYKITDPSATFLDSLNQEQKGGSDQLDYNLRFIYTEPVGKKEFLQLSYNRRNYSNENNRDVYDIKNNQKIFNEVLSNRYLRDYYYDQVGLTFRRNRKKANLSAGIQWQTSALNGEIISDEQVINRPFKAWLPSMSWQYDFSNTKNLQLNYTTNFREPRMEQLQPFVDNSNPLNLYIGNPELDPEYIHRLNLQFMWFDQFTFTNIFASVNGRYTQDKITNATIIDEQFRQITQPINVKNDLVIDGNMSFGTPLKFIKSKFNINLDGSYNRGILFINTISNNMDKWYTSLDISLENRKKEFVDILGGVEWAFNKTSYSVNTDFNQIFSSLNYYGDLSFNFKKGWNFNTTLDYTFYQGDSFNDLEPVPMWAASISKSFLKNRRGELKLAAVDILNQGVGIDRNSTLNYIEDTRINSLGRYVMLSFTYSLSAFGDQGMGGIQISSRRR
jgi:outer membrane beta-barrel protein